MGVNLPTSNFNIGIPIVDLGGRGLAANLTLYYNSNVWGAHWDGFGNLYHTFDPIQSFPSPGFSLGFGRIAYYDWQYDPTYIGSYQLMLIDADGTRHPMGRVWQSTTSTTTTTDGTRITYVGSVSGGGTLYYPNGTRVTINFINNRMLPTQIIEPNGNYIQVAYKAAWQGYLPMAIDTVTDTLGRVIQFSYSGANLIGVSPPSGANAVFLYTGVTMNTNFSQGTVENVGSSFSAIQTVYSPQRPPLQFTYSGYGMAYQVSWSDNGLSGSVNYNYPTGGEEIYGAITYSQRTETATNATTGVYSYSGSTITRPDGSTLTLNGGPASELKDSTGTTWAKTTCTYANDPGGVNQVQSITTYDETNTPTKVDFSYDQYGNETQKREYGNQIGGVWKVRRRTQTTYATTALTANTSSMNLATRVEIFDALENTNDADDVLIKKTEYQYDSAALTYYSGANPPGYSASYALLSPGNPTGTTEWTDLATNTTVSHTQNVDMFGNVVQAQVSCCNEQNYTYTQNTYWSKAEQVTKGNPNSTHLTSTMVYDFNTGTLSSQSDPNNQTTSYTYDSSQNPTGITMPTNATNTTAYNVWGQATSTTQQYVDSGVTKTITTSIVYDGFGQPIQEINQHGGQVNMSYNNMGRMVSRTNPFPQGGTPGPATTYQYDPFGRQTVATTPDNSSAQTTYSGKLTTLTDQVNRKIKREVDSLGRLIKVTEQDAFGTLTQETNYTYDLADNLLQVNQGNQLRTFKYDSAGRLIYEKIPEQTATINDGTGTLWTTKYTYTDFNKIATKTDARGVVITLSYDSLNRLTGLSYNTTNAPGVVATSSVTYTFDNNQSSSTKGLLLSTAVGSNYSESYTYDSNKRRSAVTRTIDSRSYSAYYEYNQANQLTKLTYPSGLFYYFNYDASGGLQSLSTTQGQNLSTGYLTGVNYNVSGKVTGWTLGNGVVESFGYDTNRLQLTSQTATKGATNFLNLTDNYNATAGQSGVGSTAGDSGQLMSITGTINGATESASYTYDDLGRLVTSNQTSNGSSAQRRFQYDRWGNRTSVYDAIIGGNQIQSVTLQQSGGAPTNQLTSVTNSGKTFNYTYDNAGNVTNDGAHSYQYDAENRVVSVDSGITASSSYDHQNRRIKKTVGLTVTHYIWEGGQVIAEHNGSTGVALVNYLYNRRQMIAQVVGSTTTYYLNDRLSVRALMDDKGNVIGRQAHLPFGEDFAESGNQQKQHFTNYERDNESASDYAVNRQYAPDIGRFNRPDPLASSARKEAPQTWNRYTYAVNEPVDQSDPSGLLLASSPCDDNEGIPGYCPPWYERCDCEEGGGGIGGGGGGGGGDIDSPTCSIEVHDRPIESFPGKLHIPGARHGYIVFKKDIFGPFSEDIYFEGQKVNKGPNKGKLKAVGIGDDHLSDDQPTIDRLDGEATGTFVCAWLAILELRVQTVNSAPPITYHWYGPNSSSVLRYLLEGTKGYSWYHMPFMVGYGTKLPGVE
jgi:RHS repeat-associated protein